MSAGSVSICRQHRLIFLKGNNWADIQNKSLERPSGPKGVLISCLTSTDVPKFLQFSVSILLPRTCGMENQPTTTNHILYTPPYDVKKTLPLQRLWFLLLALFHVRLITKL